MGKRDLEEYVLGLAKPLLLSLYGDYEIDFTQVDRPDAAISVSRPHKRFGRDRNPIKVGVEITTVDSKGALAYLNDEKFGCDLVSAQIDNSLSYGVDSDRPTKKIGVKVGESYIYDGAKSKANKYSDYASAGNFGEVILLCFSEFVCVDSTLFKEKLSRWTNFHMSVNRFPFDKVLFVSLGSRKAVKVYDKRNRLSVRPVPYGSEDTLLRVEGPFMRTNVTYQLDKIISNEPLIAPKSNGKSKR